MKLSFQCLKILLIALMVFGLYGCMTSTNSRKSPPVIFESSRSPALGSVIIIHGLNLAPEKMDSLAKAISSSGYAVWRLALDNRNSAVQLSEDWIENLNSTYLAARQREPLAPISIIAHSLGAPLTIEFLRKYTHAKVDNLIFLAPALALKGRAIFVRLLLPLRWLGVSLPSLAPPNYREHSVTSLSAYKELFDLYDLSKSIGNDSSIRQANISIFIDKDDELISYNGLKMWVSDNKLTNVVINEVRASPFDKTLPKHLIIDRDSLGDLEWSKLLAKIEDIIGVGIN